MHILFIGGTGIISTECVRLALQQGYEVSVLNRGNRKEIAGTRSLLADVSDFAAARSAIGSRHWDAVVDFTAFIPEDAKRRIELFQDKTSQYVFISSASAYQKPVQQYRITESTPLENPFWQYARDKAACEVILLAASAKGILPTTVVRPSLTYGYTHVPLAMNSWGKPYTVVDRMRRGLPVIVPGDGTSLWTITHSADFAKGLVGLLGNAAAYGEAFHITSDEVLTWDLIFRATATAAGVPEPKLVHIASDFIAACLPDNTGSLLGDKAVSAVFDNSKIKRFVPGFEASIPFAEGIAQVIANMDADSSLRAIDNETNRAYDTLVEAYGEGLEIAKQRFA